MYVERIFEPYILNQNREPQTTSLTAMLTVFCSFRAASCFWRCSSPNTAQVFSHTPAGSSDPSQQAGSKNASVDGWYRKEKTDHTTHRLRANSGYLHRYVPHSRSRRYYPNMRSFLGRLVRLSRKR